MSEQLDLTAAIVPPSQTSYRVSRLTLDWDGQLIRVGLTASDGTAFDVSYTGTTAVQLMTTLNSANLSLSSLHKRILNKLVADGKIAAGTVSGIAS